jgi:hypothetical protein
MQEIFQDVFKLILIVGQVLYLRRLTIEHPNRRIIVPFWCTDKLDIGGCRFDLFLVLVLCISEFTLK